MSVVKLSLYTYTMRAEAVERGLSCEMEHGGFQKTKIIRNLALELS